jgi:2-dehydropantoate 2-reductase
MRFCIFGAGAIGGLMAARLAAKGDVAVTVIARGPHLAAMQARGLRLVGAESDITVPVRAVATAEEAGPQDYVLVTLKANAMPAAAPQISALLGPDTALVSAVNGIPWWYFHGMDSAHAGRRVDSVDPDGTVTALLPPERAIGCIVYPAAEVREPGVITHTYGDRFTLGEPSGERTARVNALSEALIAAGFKAPIRPKIRDEIWVKLWGNLAFNPLSALTSATLDVITGDPGTRGIARAMMLEAQEIAQKLGVRFSIDVDKRIAGAAEVGVHKTSMLQDLERGRPMEIEALLGVVVEFAALTSTPAPTCETVLALVRCRARMAGCL